MAELASGPNIIIVDPAVATSGSGSVAYSKLPGEELWYRIGTAPWTLINENVVTGKRGTTGTVGWEVSDHVDAWRVV